MDFKIIWTEPAIEALGEIVRHIAVDNATAARDLGMQLVEHMEVAAQFPQMGPIYSRSDGVEIRCLTHGTYRLYYRLGTKPSAIEVVSVRHTSRQAPEF